MIRNKLQLVLIIEFHEEDRPLHETYTWHGKAAFLTCIFCCCICCSHTARNLII